MGGRKGRSVKREGIRVHMWLIYAARQQKLTQHWKAIILQLKKNIYIYMGIKGVCGALVMIILGSADVIWG